MSTDDSGSIAEYYSDPADEDGEDFRSHLIGPSTRQIALECATRCADVGGDSNLVVERAKRFEQYLTTGT